MTLGEYATLIYYWNGDPKPEKLGEMISFLAAQNFQFSLPRALGMAGVILGLETLYPGSKSGWRLAYPGLYKRIDESIRTGGQCMADFFIGRWLILHDMASLDELLDCVHDGGDASYYARQVIETATAKCIPFDAAIKKAQRARADRMILKTVH